LPRHRGRKRAMQFISSFLSTLPLLLNALAIIGKILKYIYSSMSSLFSIAKEKKKNLFHTHLMCFKNVLNLFSKIVF